MVRTRSTVELASGTTQHQSVQRQDDLVGFMNCSYLNYRLCCGGFALLRPLQQYGLVTYAKNAHPCMYPLRLCFPVSVLSGQRGHILSKSVFLLQLIVVSFEHTTLVLMYVWVFVLSALHPAPCYTKVHNTVRLVLQSVAAAMCHDATATATFWHSVTWGKARSSENNCSFSQIATARFRV